MRVAVTGSTGLIGSALVSALRGAGHSVTRVVRQGRPATKDERVIVWNPARGVIEAASLEGHDAVVHLAGESVAGIWTHSKKARIRDSRLRGTTLIAGAMAGLASPPAVLVAASAIGYYGNRPADEALDESASRGSGFLADLVAEWEAATQLAAAGGVRVVNTRLGIVLSAKGGALPPLLTTVKIGVGGHFGSGRQVWSWVALDDVIGALLHALDHAELEGPVNVVAPSPVTNAEFVKTLGRVVHRPTILHIPAFLLRAFGGQMAEEALLSGSNVVPRKLNETGYAFRCPRLEPALRSITSQT